MLRPSASFRVNSAFLQHTSRTSRHDLFLPHGHQQLPSTIFSLVSQNRSPCVHHAPIDWACLGAHFIVFAIMKLRTTPSRSLQRYLQSTASRNENTRRGICIQCRQQLRGQNGRFGAGGTSSRFSSRSLIPPPRMQCVLPAPFIAGQRRTLATVQNGTHALRAYANSSNPDLAVNPDDRGPMNEYDDRVAEGRLRDDEHQRG
jgi:hypothetical protein